MDASTQNDSEELLQKLREFINKWMLNAKAKAGYGLEILQEISRYAELFNSSEQEPPRILHISKFKFHAPINYPPKIDSKNEVFIKHFNKWQYQLINKKIIIKLIPLIIEQIEKGFNDNFVNELGRNIKVLTLVGDIYAMAWLDAYIEITELEFNQTLNIKLVSGSERLKKAAPERVITPMQLLSHFIKNCFQDDPTLLDTLKNSIDMVLAPFYKLESQHETIEVPIKWCERLCDYKEARKSAQKCFDQFLQNHDAENYDVEYLRQQTDKAIIECQNINNLLVARPQQEALKHSTTENMGQSLFSSLQDLLTDSKVDNESFHVNNWIKVIEQALIDTKDKLGEHSHWIPLFVVSLPQNEFIRNPPPLQINEFTQLILLSRHKNQTDLEKFREEVTNQQDKHLVFLLGGIALCIMGRWRVARRSFALASENSKLTTENLIEARYGCIVSQRIAAETIDDLVVAENKIQELIAEYPLDIRFKLENLSLKTVKLWVEHKTNVKAKAVCQQAFKLLLSELDFYQEIKASISQVKFDSSYAIHYGFQEYCCDILQLYWLSSYQFNSNKLMSTDLIFDRDTKIILKKIAEDLAEHCFYLKNDSTYVLPVVTELVQITTELGKLSFDIQTDISIDKNGLLLLCKKPANKLIPVVDNHRYRFFAFLVEMLLPD